MSPFDLTCENAYLLYKNYTARVRSKLEHWPEAMPEEEFARHWEGLSESERRALVTSYDGNEAGQRMAAVV